MMDAIFWLPQQSQSIIYCTNSLFVMTHRSCFNLPEFLIRMHLKASVLIFTFINLLSISFFIPIWLICLELVPLNSFLVSSFFNARALTNYILLNGYNKLLNRILCQQLHLKLVRICLAAQIVIFIDEHEMIKPVIITINW